jgi:hypothetical protein
MSLMKGSPDGTVEPSRLSLLATARRHYDLATARRHYDLTTARRHYDLAV